MPNFVTPRTWNVSELVTKAMLDEQIRDQFNAVWVGIASGDIDYYSEANAKARLGKPSVDSLLKMGNAGTLSWQALTTLTGLPGTLHKKDQVNFNPGGQSFSGSWADITGATLTLTLSVACTIFVRAVVTGYNGTAGRGFYVRAMVDGVADSNANPPFNGGASTARNESLPYLYYAINVPAGSRIVKLQCQADTTPNVVERGHLEAVAFVE